MHLYVKTGSPKNLKDEYAEAMLNFVEGDENDEIGEDEHAYEFICGIKKIKCRTWG